MSPAPEGVIVVAGEALMDVVVSPDGQLAAYPGGGPYNVARTVGRLEQPIAYLGSVSTDAFGVRLRRELERDGVGLQATVATDAPTTLALAELDAAGAATYRFYSAETASPALTFEQATRAFPREPGTFYLGTLGLVFEPLASTLETLVGEIGESTLVAIDPNCRPAAIDDPARYRERLARLLIRTDVVKVSEDDLAWLDPGTDPIRAARGLLAEEQSLALVTLGGKGALAVTREEVVEVTAPAVKVVDTIGAGDSFMGAFLADWRERGLGRQHLAQLEEVRKTVEFACQVAAITCTRAGADPPRATELEVARGG